VSEEYSFERWAQTCGSYSEGDGSLASASAFLLIHEIHLQIRHQMRISLNSGPVSFASNCFAR